MQLMIDLAQAVNHAMSINQANATHMREVPGFGPNGITMNPVYYRLKPSTGHVQVLNSITGKWVKSNRYQPKDLISSPEFKLTKMVAPA